MELSRDFTWLRPADLDVPGERRMRLPPYDLLEISLHAPCPFCAIEFKASTGFMSHLIVEHWCGRDLALDCWRQLGENHPERLSCVFPIHLEAL